MPIIKPRNPGSTRQAPAEQVASTVSANESVTDQVASNAEPAPPTAPEHQTQGSPLLSILALALGAVLSVVTFFGYTSWKQSQIEQQIAWEKKEEEEQRVFVDITGSVDVFEKVSSLTSLTKREFEANTVALIEAQKTADSAVTLSALEIIVNKNRQDLASYKERLIALLLELNELRSRNPESVMQQISSRAADAELRASSESARLLQLLEKILTGVPINSDPVEYFKVAVDDSI